MLQCSNRNGGGLGFGHLDLIIGYCFGFRASGSIFKSVNRREVGPRLGEPKITYMPFIMVIALSPKTLNMMDVRIKLMIQ
jgi:hypothetical protein